MELQQLVPELEIRDLIVSLHKKEILHKINLTVYKGEMISLLGPSGCGKSTLLKTVAGLLEAQGGDVCIEGSSVLNMPTEKRGAVIVFQDLRLFPNLSVEGNIEIFAQAQRNLSSEAGAAGQSAAGNCEASGNAEEENQRAFRRSDAAGGSGNEHLLRSQDCCC